MRLLCAIPVGINCVQKEHEWRISGQSQVRQTRSRAKNCLESRVSWSSSVGRVAQEAYLDLCLVCQSHGTRIASIKDTSIRPAECDYEKEADKRRKSAARGRDQVLKCNCSCLDWHHQWHAFLLFLPFFHSSPIIHGFLWFRLSIMIVM